MSPYFTRFQPEDDQRFWFQKGRFYSLASISRRYPRCSAPVVETAGQGPPVAPIADIEGLALPRNERLSLGAALNWHGPVEREADRSGLDARRSLLESPR